MHVVPVPSRRAPMMWPPCFGLVLDHFALARRIHQFDEAIIFLNYAIEMAILVRKSKRSKKALRGKVQKHVFKIMVNSKFAWRKLRSPTAQRKVECNRFAIAPVTHPLFLRRFITVTVQPLARVSSVDFKSSRNS